MFSIGPLNTDFFRRAKTREVGGGLERGAGIEALTLIECLVGEVALVESDNWRGGGACEEKLLWGDERTTRMFEGK